jgi:hypothetical protein
MARSEQTARIERAMREKLSKQAADIMLTAADAVDAHCPVRTGHLLSNFILSVGAPFTGVAGSPEAVDYSAQDSGREAVLKYDVSRDGKIYFRNNVDYLQHVSGFLTEAMLAGAAAAPAGRTVATRSTLRTMSRIAFKKGA